MYNLAKYALQEHTKEPFQIRFSYISAALDERLTDIHVAHGTSFLR